MPCDHCRCFSIIFGSVPQVWLLQPQSQKHAIIPIMQQHCKTLDMVKRLIYEYFCAALSERVTHKPVRAEACGEELVLWRSQNGTINSISNACPHRGAPLSTGDRTLGIQVVGERALQHLWSAKARPQRCHLEELSTVLCSFS